MRLHSMRARLIVAYAGLILLGFGGLALLAGQQISDSATAEFERRLTNETALVARGLSEVSWDFTGTEQSQDDLDSVLDGFQLEDDTRIEMYLVETVSESTSDHGRTGVDSRQPGGEKPLPLPDELANYPEILTARDNAVSVDRRRDQAGTERYYAAAPVSAGRSFVGYVQLSKPASYLQESIFRRWFALGLGVAVMTGIALLASTWLSMSLIRPLEKLRDSALHLSRGELSHRVEELGVDEIGSVAVAFNQMAERVQAMIEEQRAFASNTSHELRTPLTTMRLRTEALRHDKTLDAPTQKQYIAELDDELARLTGLIEDLVLLSRFDAGRMELGKEQFDLARLAHHITQSMIRQADHSGVSLTLEVEADAVVPVNASLNHLTILFRNLLDNAIKYTPSGGQVTWRIMQQRAAIVVTVTDTGQGIAPDSLPHLFERFYRADKSHSRSIPGTGLGLALAQSIVETYHGQIAIASPGLGQGTTVTVTWPISEMDG